MSGITTGLMLAVLGMPELIAASLIVLLLFGTRLPAVMRSLGVGITEFKKGLKGDEPADPNARLEDSRREEEVTRR